MNVYLSAEPLDEHCRTCSRSTTKDGVWVRFHCFLLHNILSGILYRLAVDCVNHGIVWIVSIDTLA